jgi:hypothetical protein
MVAFDIKVIKVKLLPENIIIFGAGGWTPVP